MFSWSWSVDGRSSARSEIGTLKFCIALRRMYAFGIGFGNTMFHLEMVVEAGSDPGKRASRPNAGPNLHPGGLRFYIVSSIV